MKDVFISYKAEEAEEASWVKSVLESNGISCWMAPSSIPGGSSYAREIPQAIRGCKVFVLILSAQAQSSQWVSREVDLAINEKKVVLPFMLENCTLRDDFNFYLTNVQRYTAYENKSAAVEKMLREIKAIVGNVQPHESINQTNETSIDKKQAEKKLPKFDLFCLLSCIFGALSIVCLFGVFIIPNIAALVFAIMGINSLTKKGGKGKGFALTGLVLGSLANLIGFSFYMATMGFVLSLIIDVIAVALYLYLKNSKLKKK